ncbi:MAG: phage adaptor protein [Planctomycetota bacterium]|jgi:hypothetical protein
MASALTLLNKLLRGLRQDTLGSGTATDKYHLLLVQYLNEAKEEVEEAWEWQALRQTVTVTLAQGTAEYALTAAGAADVNTNDRSKLLYEAGFHGSARESGSRGFGSLPCVWDVTDQGEYRLSEVNWERMEQLHFTDDDDQQDPQYFAILNDGTNLKIKVWPLPADARTLKMRLYIPEAELADTDLDTTTVTVNNRAVWTLALWKANAERGEEIAQPGGFAEMSYRKALSDGIAREQTFVDITSFPM